MHTFVRSRRAVWGDARFLIGIAVVLLSIGGVWAVVSSAGATTPLLQASRTIVKGEALASGDFQIVEVGLGAVADRYLAPQDLQPGQVASQTVRAGELLAGAAVEDASAARTTTIVVESGTGIPADVGAGSEVELWAAPSSDDAAQEPPRILVADATVAAVTETESVLAAGGSTVEVVIERADVAAVLGAITGGSILAVVPIGATP